MLTLLFKSLHLGDDNNEIPPPCECHTMPIGSCPSIISTTIKLIQQVSDSGVPNRDDVQCPVGKLNIPEWKHRLHGYSDSDDVIAGNEFGWELGVEDASIPQSTFRNHPSAHEFEEAVDEYIKTELEHGTLCGPLPEDCGLNLVISPIGTVPKPPDKRPVIVDSSFPPGQGVNDFIPKNSYKGNYSKLKLSWEY